LDGKVAKRIAAMRVAVEDNIPEEWLSDYNMKGYNPEYHGFVTSIEEGLSAVLHKSDAVAAAAFIKGCLRLDPKKRFSADECGCHEWLDKANLCSCCL
jgi:serine/threonine protein kinase